MKINLGSGYRKIDGYWNIDNREETKPDQCFDITLGLPYENNSISEVRAYDILEHIPIGKVVPLIEEIYRVLEPNGRFISMTPSTDGRGAFQDPTHVSFWNINTWTYYIVDIYRELYGIKAKFKVDNLHDEYTDVDNRVIHTFADLRKV